MSLKKYYDIPSLGQAFEVTPNCCSMVVYYGGPVFEILGKNDDPGRGINSWDLECEVCIPGLEIIPVSKEFYKEKYAFVMKQKELLAQKAA